MSALGQKQTFALQQAMSALHPIATAKADSRKRSCPLCPRKRTLAAYSIISSAICWRRSDHPFGLLWRKPMRAFS